MTMLRSLQTLELVGRGGTFTSHIQLLCCVVIWGPTFTGCSEGSWGPTFMGCSEGSTEEKQEEELTPSPHWPAHCSWGHPLPRVETLLYTQIYNSLQALWVFLTGFRVLEPQIRTSLCLSWCLQGWFQRGSHWLMWLAVLLPHLRPADVSTLGYH